MAVCLCSCGRGLDEASYVESFLVLNAVGAECLDEFDVLREGATVLMQCADVGYAAHAQVRRLSGRLGR